VLWRASQVGTPEPGKYRIALDSDDPQFGGPARVGHGAEHFTHPEGQPGARGPHTALPGPARQIQTVAFGGSGSGQAAAASVCALEAGAGGRQHAQRTQSLQQARQARAHQALMRSSRTARACRRAGGQLQQPRVLDAGFGAQPQRRRLRARAGGVGGGRVVSGCEPAASSDHLGEATLSEP